MTAVKHRSPDLQSDLKVLTPTIYILAADAAQLADSPCHTAHMPCHTSSASGSKLVSEGRLSPPQQQQ